MMGKELGWAVSVWLFCDVLRPECQNLTEVSEKSYTPKNPVRSVARRQRRSAVTGMGNQLVAKLAFFPPDPAKYAASGVFIHMHVGLLWC